ncbi:LytTR family DNA-binding domain-containing protein [soil metagenome]
MIKNLSKIKAVIIDDTAQARKLLRIMLENIAPDIEVVGEAADAFSGNELVILHHPDVIFLDIEMPGKSGIQLATSWVEGGIKTCVIFTTAYNEYAVAAFRLSAVDYLLKPIVQKDLTEAVNKIRSSMHNSDNTPLKQLTSNLTLEHLRSITIPVTGGFAIIPLDEIITIEADGSYARVNQVGGKLLVVAKNLKYFELALSIDSRFVRVHRSYLINLDHVRKFASGSQSVVVMSDGTKADVAREKREHVLSRINN